METDQKVCVIGLKQGIGPSGHTYGYVFERLERCCDKFKRWFGDTGNHKFLSFDQRSSEERNGFNLVSRGSEMVVELRADNDPSKVCKVISADTIDFCPFCGTKIEVKVEKVVELVDKYEQKRVGFEEIILCPKPETGVDHANGKCGCKPLNVADIESGSA